VDLRKRRSQEKLQLALAQHLQSKTIDEITIGELTKTAGVSRQTFYSNFDSKQSILLSRIESLFEKAWAKTEVDTISDFYAGGIIGTVQGWLIDETSMKDISSVARQIGRLIPHGLDGYIAKPY